MTEADLRLESSEVLIEILKHKASHTDFEKRLFDMEAESARVSG
jgi:hypothetical protein